MSNQNEKFIFDKGIGQAGFKYVVKYILALVYDFIYKLLFIRERRFPQKKYYLSICGIFKNEAPYLKEWIEYHLLMGFEHFYLYNNNSDDNYVEVLNPYIESGVVTLIEWPHVPGQLKAYQHFYEYYRGDTTWVSFLDMDEFFCPLQETTVVDWLMKFKKYPLIMVYWKFFGSSGLMAHDHSKLVIEQYHVCYPKMVNIGKLLYNTNYEVENFHVGMMHNFNVKFHGFSIPPINQYNKFVKYGIHRYKNNDDIQCNHYWSKSFGNYEAKHKRGSAAFGKSWKTFDKFVANEHLNTSTDYSIYRFIIELKLKMSRPNKIS